MSFFYHLTVATVSTQRAHRQYLDRNGAEAFIDFLSPATIQRVVFCFSLTLAEQWGDREELISYGPICWTIPLFKTAMVKVALPPGIFPVPHRLPQLVQRVQSLVKHICCPNVRCWEAGVYICSWTAKQQLLFINIQAQTHSFYGCFFYNNHPFFFSAVGTRPSHWKLFRL